MVQTGVRLTYEPPNRPFEARLISEVDAFLESLPTRGKLPKRAYLRILFFVLASLAIYLLYLASDASAYYLLFLSVLGGIVTAGIGFNLVHEAAHRHFQASVAVNQLLAFSLDFFGMSSYYYRVKHCSIHHGHTNVPGYDGDIEQTSLLRLSPGIKWQPGFRFQAVYALFLYALLTLSWSLYFDFKRLSRGKIAATTIEPPYGKQRVAFWLGKLNSLTFTVIIPLLVHGPIVALTCFFVFHASISIVFSLFFQLSHLFEGTSYVYPKDGRIEHSWIRHQLMTTMDFSVDNKLLSFYLGGLNFQVIHHLFPAIATDYLPAVRAIVLRVCQEEGVVYHTSPSVTAAISTHFRHLAALGRAPKTA